MLELQLSYKVHAVDELSHFDESGASRMVDVGKKPVSHRTATASGQVQMTHKTRQLVARREHAKGDVLEVARLAGIQAAKKTSDLIPLCHPLAIDAVTVDFTSIGDRTIAIEATVEVEAKTGVEMEALTAVSVAALTIYDMCKAVDRSITIQQIRLESKTGGRSGDWFRND